MDKEEYNRVIIEGVEPEIDCGSTPIKRTVGERVRVQADVFCDGRDEVVADLLYRREGEEVWRKAPMSALGNDRWEGEFAVEELGNYYYTVRGRVDYFGTWRKDLKKKYEANRDVKPDLLIGSNHLQMASERASGIDSDELKGFSKKLKQENQEAAVDVALSDEVRKLMDKYPDRGSETTFHKELPVLVDREKALFSAWYEIFPRSCGSEPGKHGSFKDLERFIPKIAEMGFDVLYFPPIHPVGRTNRRGRNNSPNPEPKAPGSPWSIGNEDGGHKSVHPELGTVEDFEEMVKKAKGKGLEVALDLTFNCSFDHPYIDEHPEWFKWRPDDKLQSAENPPKKYEDVVPFDFETEKWRELWRELKSIVLFWIDKGVKIFRVDNPHTKPFEFWDWLIGEVREEHPEVVFLSEAFTRPKVMYKLAKVGFNQSYTYFTWRNTKWELKQYLKELTRGELREYFRPNFWPNTPDILPEYLQYGGRPAFIIRLVLAATLSSNYGIYGPAFELCENEALEDKEEYKNSEKYEIKNWEWDKPGNIRKEVKKINKIRKENEALQTPWNLEFYEVDNEEVIAYGKTNEDLTNIILVIVNLDPHHTQSGWVRVPIEDLGIPPYQPYLVHDLFNEEKFVWNGEWNYIELDPKEKPAHIFLVKKKLRREKDFDYFV
ncbi:hypothetical protein AKJ36_02185 [candidate division MSBL1 archaeon SCGC-AAA259I07]|uniref:Alpha-1,4-glucan:maltose-1-phosphate maltosyltransferase n=1 Tax=candidate division MSBL1 archaeon SCGC-AAA259I07 TaxID=1698266 RepID=A0A133UKT5_9EURY|nr:hypothetical protein AKJ36_02185 [candidate division MSBL1 archaeon SCGC-AAA259I07]